MRDLIELEIDRYCASLTGPISEPVKYALSGGGHRIRPMLTLLWCEACGVEPECALSFALAVELIHTASLIHDDLPSMDNSDFRRGKPSCHRQYGEAIATLAGDILLSEAIRVVSDNADAVNVLTSAMADMTNGQALELIGNLDWMKIHVGKTGALLSAACELGVIVANGDEHMRIAAREYGHSLGLAYQYRDDLHDNDGSVRTLGCEQVDKLRMVHRDACVFAAPNAKLRMLAEDILS